MKKWMKYILAFALLLVVIVPTLVSAKAHVSVELQAKDQNVTVTLNLPEGKTETITTLQLKLYVAMNGEAEAPEFEFSERLPSYVKDADVREENGLYIVDLILAGKKGQDIFQDKESVVLGTLSLNPKAETYTAETGIVKEVVDGEEVPVVRYVDRSGYAVQTVTLTNTDPITITKEKEKTPTPTPEETETPTPTPTPKETKTPTPTPKVSPTPTHAPEVPPVENVRLVKRTTSSLQIAWDAVKGADEYAVYGYQSGKKGSKHTLYKVTDKTRIKLKGLKQGSQWKFTVKAMKKEGTHIYYSEKSSNYVYAFVKAAKPKIKSAKRTGKKVTVRLKGKISGAKGYRYYVSTKKKGSYKYIGKSKGTKVILKKVPKKAKYIKVCAYNSGWKKVKPQKGVWEGAYSAIYKIK